MPLMKELFRYSNIALEATEDIADILGQVGLYTDNRPHSEKYNGQDIGKHIFAMSKTALNKVLMFGKILHAVHK